MNENKCADGLDSRVDRGLTTTRLTPPKRPNTTGPTKNGKRIHPTISVVAAVEGASSRKLTRTRVPIGAVEV